jgi:hypothetical protein
LRTWRDAQLAQDLFQLASRPDTSRFARVSRIAITLSSTVNLRKTEVPAANSRCRHAPLVHRQVRDVAIVDRDRSFVGRGTRPTIM